MSQNRNLVRRAREKRQWTLLHLATVMGHPQLQGHLSRIERGEVQARGITQERIAEALGVPRDELFPLEDEKAS